MMNALLLILFLAAPPTCDDALTAQDEVISLQEAKIAELEKALSERESESAYLRLQVTALEAQAEAFRKMAVLYEEDASRARRMAFWAEKWTAMKWGAVGFAGGILLERVAE